MAEFSIFSPITLILALLVLTLVVYLLFKTKAAIVQKRNLEIISVSYGFAIVGIIFLSISNIALILKVEFIQQVLEVFAYVFFAASLSQELFS